VRFEVDRSVGSEGGPPVTFDEFVAFRLGALLRYATVVTCDAYLAEDITQDVLVRAQARWARISAVDAPEHYVKRMVLNEFLSWRRRRAARVVPLAWEHLDLHAAPAADPSAAFDDRDAVLRLVAALPPRQRAAVALRFYEDLPDEEIADLLGCRSVTVRSLISRALATLRKSLPASLVTTLEKL
jgi:RNA polymerase sigma-70 factor (sigma-E family)